MISVPVCRATSPSAAVDFPGTSSAKSKFLWSSVWQKYCDRKSSGRQTISPPCLAASRISSIARERFFYFARNDNSVTVSLLHRISRHDFDALDHDAFGRFARFAHAVSGDRNITDFLEHILAFNQFTKGCVLMVEPVHSGEADEELRAGRIRIGAARHRNHTAVVAMIVELGLDLVTRTTLSVTVLFRRILRIW